MPSSGIITCRISPCLFNATRRAFTREYFHSGFLRNFLLTQVMPTHGIIFFRTLSPVSFRFSTPCPFHGLFPTWPLRTFPFSHVVSSSGIISSRTFKSLPFHLNVALLGIISSRTTPYLFDPVRRPQKLFPSAFSVPFFHTSCLTWNKISFQTSSSVPFCFHMSYRLPESFPPAPLRPYYKPSWYTHCWSCLCCIAPLVKKVCLKKACFI